MESDASTTRERIRFRSLLFAEEYQNFGKLCWMWGHLSQSSACQVPHGWVNPADCTRGDDSGPANSNYLSWRKLCRDRWPALKESNTLSKVDVGYPFLFRPDVDKFPTRIPFEMKKTTTTTTKFKKKNVRFRFFYQILPYVDRVFRDELMLPNRWKFLHRHSEWTFAWLRKFPQMDPTKGFRFTYKFQSGLIFCAIYNRLQELRWTGTAGIDQVNREGPRRKMPFVIPVGIIVKSHATDAFSAGVIVGQYPSDGPFEH